MKSLIFLGLLTIFLISNVTAWDMDNPTDSNSFSSDSSGLIGKSVHIVQFDDGNEAHILTKITGISNGFLQTSDWYVQWGSWTTSAQNLNLKHHPGNHWIAIATINGMWEEPLPTDAASEETPAQPGFGSILAILGLVAIAFVLNRRS